MGNTPAGGPAGEVVDMNGQMNCRALEGKKEQKFGSEESGVEHAKVCGKVPRADRKAECLEDEERLKLATSTKPLRHTATCLSWTDEPRQSRAKRVDYFFGTPP